MGGKTKLLKNSSALSFMVYFLDQHVYIRLVYNGKLVAVKLDGLNCLREITLSFVIYNKVITIKFTIKALDYRNTTNNLNHRDIYLTNYNLILIHILTLLFKLKHSKL